jgi:hypothetical protein
VASNNTTSTLHASWKHMYHTHLVYNSHFSTQVHFCYEGDDRTCFFFSLHFFLVFSFMCLSPVLPMCCGYLLLHNLIFVLCKRSQSLECLKPETLKKYFLCRATFHPDCFIHLRFCVMFYALEQYVFNALVLWDETFCTWVGRGKVHPVTCHEGTDVG